MNAAFRYAFQICIYVGFALLLGYFSQAPTYRPIPEGAAQVKLSFAHGGKPIGGCRDRTEAELQALAANMRKPQLCSRERVAVTIVFELDGVTVFEEVTLRLRNTTRTEGWDYQAHRVVELDAGQILAIDFDPSAGGFIISSPGSEG